MGKISKFMLCGSVVLRRIFEEQSRLSYDDSGVLLSALSLCSPAWETAEETENTPERVITDIFKSFPQKLSESGCDFAVVDFYSTAAISLYQHGDSFYTATDHFKKSDFYKKHKDELTLISQPFEETLWKPAIAAYAELMKKQFGGNIVLLRLGFSERAVKRTELRTTPIRSSLNRRIQELENYFISLVDPIVIDAAKLYFLDLEDSSPSAFEEYFYAHVRGILGKLAEGSRKRLYNWADPEIQLERVLRYYNSMSTRAFWSWLLDDSDFCKLLRYTSRQFILEHKQMFLRLRKERCILGNVEHILAGEPDSAELIAAAKALKLLLAEDISQPYSSYSVIFRRELNMRALAASLLSDRLGRRVALHDCEAVLLLLGQPQKLQEYFAASPAVTVDIWGSCVCRESVNRSPELISVDKYIFKQPCLLAFDDPVPCEIPESAAAFGGSGWRRRTVYDALARRGTEILQDSSARWVLVDFYDLISRLSVLDGQHAFECDSFLRRTDFFSSIKNRCSDAYLFDLMDMPDCNREMMKFAEFLISRYGRNIILVKARPNSHFIDLDGKLQPLPDPDGTLARKQDFIRSCEDIFAQITRCYVIDVSQRFYSDDSFPMGGTHLVHYEEEFYRTCCAHINNILNGAQGRYFSECDERYFLLRDGRLSAE